MDEWNNGKKHGDTLPIFQHSNIPPFLLLLLLILPLASPAQQITQTVRGTVLDSDTRTSLVGVSITYTIAGETVGTVTDVNGKFRLENVPVGRQTFYISYVGYQGTTLSNVEVTSGKEVVLDIRLVESVTELEELVISATGDKSGALSEIATVSARQFSVEEAQRFAGSRNEPARMVANYAGVSGANDARNDIIIRGNSPNGLLWRFEQLDIPSPNHFAGVGASGGPISMLNYNVLSNSDFMTSAFPSPYGNAISGAFDLNMRKGNNEKNEYMFQLGALGTEAMVEGPLAKNYEGSFLINYRYATTSILRELGIDFGYSGNPTYQDAAFNFYLPTKKAGIFKVFGLLGTSDFRVKYDELQEENFEEGETESNNRSFKNKIGVVGISHQMTLSPTAYMQTTLGAMGRNETGRNDSVSTEDRNLIIPFWKSDNYEYTYTLHSTLYKKFSARHNWVNGVKADYIDFQIKEGLYNEDTGQMEIYRDGSGGTYLLQAYSNWRYTPLDRLIFNVGLHYQTLTLNNSAALEPRAGVRWNIEPGKALNFGYGLHSQMQIMPVYYVATLTDAGIARTNKDLGFTRSHHWVLGYDQKLGKELRLKAETYYQRLYNVPVTQRNSSFSTLNEGTNYIYSDEDSLVNNGTGRNFGLELTLEKFFSRGYYFLFTASLFDSRYRASDDILRNTAFNGNYVFNLLGGKEFRVGKKNNFIVFDGKVSFAGGRRYTPIDIAASQQAGSLVEDESQAFSLQYSPYFRTDIKITYRINRRVVSHEIFLNIDNVFNTQNVFSQTYSSRTGNVEYIYQLGMFPTFQYKLQF